MESAGIHLRHAAARALDTLGGRRVHVVGDTIVDTFTYTTMIGGQTKTPTMSVLFDKKGRLHRRRRRCRQAFASRRRRRDVLNSARVRTR